jgi:hypothetical protein
LQLAHNSNHLRQSPFSAAELLFSVQKFSVVRNKYKKPSEISARFLFIFPVTTSLPFQTLTEGIPNLQRLKTEELRRCIVNQTYASLMGKEKMLFPKMLAHYPNTEFMLKDKVFVDFLNL